MAKAHAHRMYSLGIDLETIRRWLVPSTTWKERGEILAALRAKQ